MGVWVCAASSILVCVRNTRTKYVALVYKRRHRQPKHTHSHVTMVKPTLWSDFDPKMIVVGALKASKTAGRPSTLSITQRGTGFPIKLQSPAMRLAWNARHRPDKPNQNVTVALVLGDEQEAFEQKLLDIEAEIKAQCAKQGATLPGECFGLVVKRDPEDGEKAYKPTFRVKVACDLTGGGDECMLTVPLFDAERKVLPRRAELAKDMIVTMIFDIEYMWTKTNSPKMHGITTRGRAVFVNDEADIEEFPFVDMPEPSAAAPSLTQTGAKRTRDDNDNDDNELLSAKRTCMSPVLSSTSAAYVSAAHHDDSGN